MYYETCIRFLNPMWNILFSNFKRRIATCSSFWCCRLSLIHISFITAQGFTTTSMVSVLIGAICNITLDPIFIFGFHMGVKGAALATVLSQAVSTILSLIHISIRQPYGFQTFLPHHLPYFQADLLALSFRLLS